MYLIKTITVGRVFNLGHYENERFELTADVQLADQESIIILASELCANLERMHGMANGLREAAKKGKAVVADDDIPF